MKKRLAITAIVLSLAALLAVGASLAYLFVDTTPIVNTFVYGDINITLTESETNYDSTDGANANANTYKMIPGNTLPKDPEVTVKSGSEACWLFIKIEKANDPDKYLDYKINSCWTALDGVDGVYYYNGNELNEFLATDKTYSVLDGDEVTVKATVKKGDLAAIGTNYPKLTFTAYAVQKANVTEVAEAWKLVGTKGAPVTTADAN